MVVEVENLTHGTSYATEEVHFSGGLRGFPTNRGWALFPISENEDSNTLVFQTPDAHARFAKEECGVLFLGTCVKYQMDSNKPRMDVWESGPRDHCNGLNAADSWGAIAHQAAEAGHAEYADCASYISISLKVAGLRLRDVSNRYHEQLRWALADCKTSGTWFSNAALFDLYADFHSLVSELSSSRDYLARLAAIHAGAPDRIDSLARLEDWVKKPVNHDIAHQPLVAMLLAESGTDAAPGWLRRLGAIRNEMLHRVPMGANKAASGLTLLDVSTSYGPIKTIRLAEPLQIRALADQSPDPLVELSQINIQLEHLCRAAWKQAKYPAKLLEFESKAAT